ncbi:uncharacterized protein PG986_008674 [Apiospora aurea]|uniref:Uncharacterized protein n=1 Tax=Apiospora aurea TaxID=335848 RepID=A0ABR1Q5P9_9PEZI
MEVSNRIPDLSAIKDEARALEMRYRVKDRQTMVVGVAVEQIIQFLERSSALINFVVQGLGDPVGVISGHLRSLLAVAELSDSHFDFVSAAVARVGGILSSTCEQLVERASFEDRAGEALRQLYLELATPDVVPHPPVSEEMWGCLESAP